MLYDQRTGKGGYSIDAFFLVMLLLMYGIVHAIVKWSFKLIKFLFTGISSYSAGK